MTEDEEARADALDEEYTKNPPTPGPNGTGAWTKWRRNAAPKNNSFIGLAENQPPSDRPALTRRSA